MALVLEFFSNVAGQAVGEGAKLGELRRCGTRIAAIREHDCILSTDLNNMTKEFELSKHWKKNAFNKRPGRLRIGCS